MSRQISGHDPGKLAVRLRVLADTEAPRRGRNARYPNGPTRQRPIRD